MRPSIGLYVGECDPYHEFESQGDISKVIVHRFSVGTEFKSVPSNPEYGLRLVFVFPGCRIGSLNYSAAMSM